MHKVYLLTALLLGALWLAVPVVMADESPARTIAPYRVTTDAGPGLEPAVAVDPNGRVYVAWKHLAEDGNSAEMLLARAPDWPTFSLAPTLPTHEVYGPASLSVDRYVRLAWRESISTVQSFSATLDMQTRAGPAAVQLPDTAQFDLDALGEVHAIWYRDQMIYYASQVAASDSLTPSVSLAASDSLTPSVTVAPSEPLTPSVAITPTWAITSPATVIGLSWRLGADGAPHLAWLASDGGEAVQLYALEEGAGVLVKAGRDIHRPMLAVDPAGETHLAWLEGDSLYYACSRDWAAIRHPAEGLAGENDFALAVGPDGTAHLFWFADGALWSANGADWQGSRKRLATLPALDGLAATSDGQGRVHLVWSAPDDQGHWGIYYLAPEQSDLQVAVAYPQGGELLAEETTIRVACNLPASDMLRVEFYLQQVNPGPADGPENMIFLESDGDGRDGWSAKLDPAQFEQGGMWRVFALGVDASGGLAHAYSPPFTLQPSGSAWAWLRAPQVIRGHAVLAVLADPTVKRLDLQFTPVICATPGDPTACPQPTSSTAIYGGTYDLSSERANRANWQYLPFDSARLPDGWYWAVARATDQLAQAAGHSIGTFLQIDNSMAPHLAVTSPQEGASLGKSLDATVKITDIASTVQQVDFYLERAHPLLQGSDSGQGYTLETVESRWIGSDDDGADGWSLSVPVTATSGGDGWYVRAVAYDDEGLSANARSAGTFTLAGQADPQLRLLAPTAGAVLRGVEKVRLFVLSGFQNLTGATLYRQDLDDTLVRLGNMTLSAGLWSYDWDTASVPNGEYALVIVARCRDGSEQLFSVGDLAVRNAPTSYDLSKPAPNQTVSGLTPISLPCQTDAPGGMEARFYYREESGQLHLIGAGNWGEGGWNAVWNTRAVLDGTYGLLAVVSDARGSVSSVERRVRVSNVPLSIAWRDWDTSGTWQGDKAIQWRTQHPAESAVSIQIAYSPDHGEHWIPLADGLPDDQPFLWHTRQYPDSAEALLRLEVTDGVHYAQAISPAFCLNNVNEPPHVAILAPRPATAQAGEARIAWEAQDPDGDALQFDLEYRRQGGSWQTIARATSSPYTWQTADLAPGEDYEVRVVARDPQGATASDSVAGIRLVKNRPPVVDLLWPNTSTSLNKETVILWRAHDPDQDDLVIDLFYSENAGRSWLPLAEGLENTGYYLWQVSYLPVGAQYRVRVVARDQFFWASDDSDELFSIGGSLAPDVAFLSPVPGASLSGVALLRWSVTPPGPLEYQVNIDIRRAEAESWTPLGQQPSDNGFALLDTRKYPDGPYELRMTVLGKGLPPLEITRAVSISNGPGSGPRVALLTPQSASRNPQGASQNLQGDEVWAGIQEIAWRAWDRDGGVITATLQVSTDDGQQWMPIATVDARTGYYLWDTHQISGKSCLLRIIVSDGQTSATATSDSAFYLANRRGRPPSLSLLSPDPAGKLLPGSLLSWIAEDPDGDPLRVSLSISADGGLHWAGLAQDTCQVGEYILDPDALDPDLAYRVRAVVEDGVYRVQQVSPPFRRAESSGQSEVRLLAPLAGATWSGTREVRWEATGLLTQGMLADIELSADGGQTWLPVVTGIPDTGTYAWDTQEVANGVYRLRLRLRDSRLSDVRVSEPFTVNNAGRNAPVISLVAPQAGGVLSGVRGIRWRAHDADGDTLRIDLYYSLDMGANWRYLAYSLADTGHYVWDTTALPNGERVWLRAVARDAKLTSYAAIVGPLTVWNAHMPVIKLIAPQGGEHLQGKYLVRWHAAQEANRRIAVSLDVSTDSGHTWQNLATNLPPLGSYLWDTGKLPQGSRVLLRVTASDGLRSALSSTTEPVVICGSPATPGLPFRFH